MTSVQKLPLWTADFWPEWIQNLKDLKHQLFKILLNNPPFVQWMRTVPPLPATSIPSLLGNWDVLLSAMNKAWRSFWLEVLLVKWTEEVSPESDSKLLLQFHHSTSSQSLSHWFPGISWPFTWYAYACLTHWATRVAGFASFDQSWEPPTVPSRGRGFSCGLGLHYLKGDFSQFSIYWASTAFGYIKGWLDFMLFYTCKCHTGWGTSFPSGIKQFKNHFCRAT